MNEARETSGWDEDELHRWLAGRPRPRTLVGSPGHDAAVLVDLGGRPVLCADQCIAGVHYDASETAPHDVGQKVVRRALSDLAATAARPVAVTLAIAAPPKCTDAWMRATIEGAAAAAEAFGCELVAGDLSRVDSTAVHSAAALGAFERALPAPGRDRAEPGQLVVVTGPLGGSFPTGRHLRPVPRFDAAATLVDRCSATALMDVSDGLAWDLFRLARASNVAIALQTGQVPVHADAIACSRDSGRTPLDHALHDGEDHELIATVPPSARATVLAEGWSVVGIVEPGAGVTIVDGADRRPFRPEDGGWRHGPS